MRITQAINKGGNDIIDRYDVKFLSKQRQIISFFFFNFQGNKD